MSDWDKLHGGIMFLLKNGLIAVEYVTLHMRDEWLSKKIKPFSFSRIILEVSEFDVIPSCM